MLNSSTSAPARLGTSLKIQPPISVDPPAVACSSKTRLEDIPLVVKPPCLKRKPEDYPDHAIKKAKLAENTGPGSHINPLMLRSSGGQSESEYGMEVDELDSDVEIVAQRFVDREEIFISSDSSF